MQRIRSVSYLISHIVTRIQLLSGAMNCWYLVPLFWYGSEFYAYHVNGLQAYHLQIMQGHMVAIQSSFSFTAINLNVIRF